MHTNNIIKKKTQTFQVFFDGFLVDWILSEINLKDKSRQETKRRFFCPVGLVFSSDFFVNCYMVYRIWEFEDSLGR